MLRSESAAWGRNSCSVLSDGVAGLGSALTINTPEAAWEHLPFEDDRGFLFTAAGRIDDRAALASALGLSNEEISGLGDGALMHRAWLRWSDSCVERLFGDWAFAVWDRKTRRLFLARDHSGITALYYHANPGFFAFSSSRRALLKLDLPPVKIDELYLAQILVSWPGYHGERTIHNQLKRLPPAHTVTVTPEGLNVRHYWRLEDTPRLLLPRKDYIPAFLEIFDSAVRSRLRCDGPVGATLSGGLDSSSVVVTAARCLRGEGRRLSAFTSIHHFATAAHDGTGFFPDELPFARAAAQTTDNIDLATVDAAGSCPIDAIRRNLRITLEPRHGAGSAFWILELRRMAAAQGCKVLLTGQAGNNGISWPGRVFSQPVPVQIRILGWRRWLRQSARWHMPRRMWQPLRRWKVKRRSWSDTAISPAFARRLDLMTRYLDDLDGQPVQPLWERFLGASPGGASFLGASQAESAAAFGLEIRDPTADARVLKFCFSVPDKIFIDPESGVDRWLIREAMKNRLPESVRMNRHRGRQAGDLVPRLRSSASAVESALAEIERGPGAEYVSVPAMRDAWAKIRIEDTPGSFALASAVLARGIMAGFFVNGFGTEW